MDCRRTLAILTSLYSLSGLQAQPVQELTGHEEPIFAVAFSPDGKQVASAGFDHRVILWDADSGKKWQTIHRHQVRVVALAYCDDGSRLATADASGTIALWAIRPSPGLRKRARQDGCWQGHDGCVHALAFTPGGRSLLSCGSDGSVKIWDMPGARLRTTFACPDDSALYALAVAADGTLVAFAGLDGVIRLHELASGKPLRSLDGHCGAVYSLAFAPDGQRLLSGGEDRELRVWDLASGTAAACLHGHHDPIYHVGRSGDGRFLVSAGKGGLVIIWDAVSGIPLYSHRFPGEALCAALAPEGGRIAVGTREARCFLANLPAHLE